MSMSSDRYITPKEVRRELNILENIESIIDSDDEFLQAILHNQKITGMLVLQMMERGGPDGGISRTNIPNGHVGISIDDISTGSTGGAIFSANGSNIYANISAKEDINREDVVVVTGEGNKVTRLTEIDGSYLSIGKIDFSGIESGGFDVHQTENNVTIGPGESKVVLDVAFNSQTFWWETGTNDETFSTYEYIVDGDNLMDNPNTQPLGLYNDMYRFPTPIVVSDSLQIKVNRNSSAGGNEDYYSKITITR